MKKNLVASFTVLALSVVLFNGCKDKEDTTPPVIVLTGSNPYALTLNSTYSEPGFTANDDEDGDITGLVAVDQSNVNKDKVGTYEVHYEVSDAAGNFADVHRTVNVANSMTSNPWTGNYHCVIIPAGTGTNYDESLSISTTLNNAMEWSLFGNYSNATAKLNIFIDGNGAVTLPTQSFSCGTIPVLRQFSGSGVTNANGGVAGSVGSTIILTVTETVNGASANFTSTYTKY